jgi:hypothetical protein
MSETGGVSITLREDDVLVLFELLGRWIEDENGAGIKALTRDDAELWALNSVYCTLESTITQPMEHNYVTLVEQARQRLRERCGDWPLHT